MRVCQLDAVRENANKVNHADDSSRRIGRCSRAAGTGIEPRRADQHPYSHEFHLPVVKAGWEKREAQ
jgi:hypothetical protein